MWSPGCKAESVPVKEGLAPVADVQAFCKVSTWKNRANGARRLSETGNVKVGVASAVMFAARGVICVDG
jgi:hypothetical protein